MSTEPRTNGTTPDEIEADIERQRDELASTVDALQARLDVKARVKDKATTDQGKPKPQVLAGAAVAVLVLGGLIVLRVRRSR
jgi:Protein of unknown function (DUF3618)